MRVLLVEDDRDLSDAVARHLRAEHVVVDIAANGREAQHRGEAETIGYRLAVPTP